MPEVADRKVRMSKELMEELFTRDDQGRHLIVDWGIEDEDGYYNPTVRVDPEHALPVLSWRWLIFLVVALVLIGAYAGARMAGWPGPFH